MSPDPGDGTPAGGGPVRSAGYLWIVGAAVLWAFIGVCTVELTDLGLPATQVGPWRALLGGACFLAEAVVVTGRVRSGAHPLRLLRSHAAGVVAFCGIGVVVFYTALPLAVETGGLSLAYVLLYTAPVWVGIGAAVWLGERLGPGHVAAIAVSVAGVTAIALSAGGTLSVTAVSITWGLLAGVSYASYYILGRRLFDEVDNRWLYAVVLLCGGVLLALVVRLDPPSAAMLPWLALLGVGCTWAPYWMFARGVTRVQSSRAVVVAMVEPVLATAIGVAAYGERLGVAGVLGAAAVLAASSWVAVSR